MKKIRLAMKVIAILLLVFTLITSRLLPLNIMIAIGVIEILLLVLTWNHKVLQVFVVVLIIITSSGLLYVESVAGRIINYNPNQANTISFFVMKESMQITIKTAVNSDANFAVSSLLDDKVVTFVEEKLKNENYEEDLVTYEGISDGISGLFDGSFDVLVVDQGFLSSILEFNPDFLKETRVIWSIVKTDEIINLSDVNVTKEPFVVYIAGVDNRDEFQANRVDVNMLAVVDPRTHNITLISVPRDAYVQLGCKTKKAMDKLTHAGIYGIDCSIETMQNLFDVEINYYATVYFDTVTNLVGALGTIDVYLDEGFAVGGYTFTEGWNVLDKNSALIVARARHEFIDGDQQRIKNQQEVMKGIINKLLEPSSLTKIESIIKSVEGTVKTNMTGDEVFALVRMQINSMKGWTYDQVALTGEDAYLPSYAMEGKVLYMVQLDEDGLDEAKDILQEALSNK